MRGNRHASTEDLSKLGRAVNADSPVAMIDEQGQGEISQHSVSGATGESLQRELLEKLRQDRRSRKVAAAENADRYQAHFGGAIIWIAALLLLYWTMRGQMSDGMGGGGKMADQQLDHDWAD